MCYLFSDLKNSHEEELRQRAACGRRAVPGGELCGTQLARGMENEAILSTAALVAPAHHGRFRRFPRRKRPLRRMTAATLPATTLPPLIDPPQDPEPRQTHDRPRPAFQRLVAKLVARRRPRQRPKRDFIQGGCGDDQEGIHLGMRRSWSSIDHDGMGGLRRGHGGRRRRVATSERRADVQRSRLRPAAGYRRRHRNLGAQHLLRRQPVRLPLGDER